MKQLARNNYPWKQRWTQPLLVAETDYRSQEPGTFSRLAGVDGRRIKELKRFPGFQLLTSIPTTIGADAGTVRWGAHANAGGLELVKFFVLQRDVGTNNYVRGFVFLGNSGTSTKLYAWYSYNGNAPEGAILHDYGTPSATEFDITSDHRQLYAVGFGEQLIIRAIDDAGTPDVAWVKMPLHMGSPSIGTPTAQTTGKLTANKIYTVAYRWVFPDQGVFTQLSPLYEVNLTQVPPTLKSIGGVLYDPDTSGVASGFLSTQLGTGASRILMQLFRTVASDFNTVGVRGLLFLEREVTFVNTASNWVAQAPLWGDATLGLSDTALVSQPSLDPDEVEVVSPTHARILAYDGLLLFGSRATSVIQVTDAEVLRWSFTDKDRINMIPLRNRRSPDDLLDTMKNIVRAGVFGVAIYDNSLFRIHRSGSILAVDPIHNQHGSGSRHGTVAFGSSLYLVSPVGLLLCDLYAGELTVVGATQRVFTDSDRWAASISGLWGAYDVNLGLMVLLNPTTREALLFWMNHGVMNELVELPFSAVVQGVNILTGGYKRAYFFNTTLGAGGSGNLAQIFEIDHDRSEATRAVTSGHLAGVTFNATVTSATTTVLTASAATFTDGILGHRCIITSGTLRGESRKITARTATSVTLDSALSGTPAVGDTFTVASVPFRLYSWPIGGDNTEGVPPDHYMEKHVVGMMSVFRDVSGDANLLNGTATPVLYQLLGGASRTVAEKTAVATLQAAPVGGRTASTAVSIDHQGGILVPGVEVDAAAIDFTLLGLYIKGEETAVVADQRPTV